MLVYTDQLSRKIILEPSKIQRIISLVPSQTELLYDLGLGERIVGITKFCIHPKEKVKNVQKIGGTKNLHLELIHSLKPDLIIANKEENERMHIESLSESFKVWVSDVNSLTDALQMIRSVGELSNTENQANKIEVAISENFRQLREQHPFLLKKKKVAYFIWREPWMLAANNTFINAMLEEIGFENVFADMSRYPEISLTTLHQLDVDYIFLSSEPYPFTEKHITEIKKVIPQAKSVLVDGEMFSWYGSRLLYAATYFRNLLSSLS
ncbi:MAG: helical backbone metal receptor [Thermonemataceae bacterium]|nr:helical backbone metal receptor [Thermonemataceae bacterium]